jgi:hypothetical protein
MAIEQGLNQSNSDAILKKYCFLNTIIWSVRLFQLKTTDDSVCKPVTDSE